MKTRLEVIKERIEKLREDLSKANVAFQRGKQNGRNASLLIKQLTTGIALLFVFTCVQAQKVVDFEEINFLGMTIDQVDASQKAVPFIRITDKPENGRQLRGFFSPSTGGFKVIFNDKGICNCIMWYTNVDRVLDYNSDLYVVNRMKDKQDPYKVVYTIMVKSLFSIR